MRFARSLAAFPLALAVLPAAGGPATYEVDPTHTFPSFEADHMGMSVFRGKFNRSRGTVVLDRDAGSGSLEVEVDVASIDFGLDELNELMAKPEYLDTARHPTARYTGKLAGFEDGRPTRVDGTLEMHGVTRPLQLEITAFNCRLHPVFKRDWCGADAHGTLDRAAFGIAAGRDYGFDMQVVLHVQVEALAVEGAACRGPRRMRTC